MTGALGGCSTSGACGEEILGILGDDCEREVRRVTGGIVIFSN